jgi:Peptidase family S41
MFITMKKSILFLLLNIFISTQVFTQKKNYNPNQKYSVAALHQDLDLLYHALDEGHPGIYRYTPKDSFTMAYQKIRTSFKDSLTEKEFRIACEPMIDLVRCGHTDLYPNTAINKYRKKHPAKDTPFSVVILQNKLYLLNIIKADTTIGRYQEIVSIDGRSSTEIIEKLCQTTTTDGYNMTHKTNGAIRSFSSYYRYLYGEQDVFQLQLKDSLGTIFEETITRDTSKAKKKTTAAITPKIKKSERNRKVTYPKEVKNTALLDIDAFAMKKTNQFYKKTFKTFQEKGIKHLIIDLRNNGGGSIMQATNLLKYLLKEPASFEFTHKLGKRSYQKHLTAKTAVSFTKLAFRFLPNKVENGMRTAIGKGKKKKKKYRFEGEIYVLTNGGSFSASCMVSSHLKDQKRAIFIGAETGGGQNGSNAIITPYLILPNTNARLRFPYWHLTHVISLPDVGRGIMPDYPISYKIEDVKTNKDKVMEKAWELIN